MKILIVALLLAIGYAQTEKLHKEVTVGSITLCAVVNEPEETLGACSRQLSWNSALGYTSHGCGFDYDDYYTICDDSMFASTRESLQDAIKATNVCGELGEKSVTLRGTQESCPIFSESVILEGNGCQLDLSNENFDCVTTRGFETKSGSYPIDKDTEYNCKITVKNETVPDIEQWESDWQTDKMAYTPANGGSTSPISQLNFVSKLSAGDVLEWKVPARISGSGYNGWKICFRSTDFKPDTCKKSWCGSQSHYFNPDMRITEDQYCAPENVFCSTCNNKMACEHNRACPNCQPESGSTTITMKKPTSETEAADSGSQSLPTFFLVLTLTISLFY